MSTIGKLRRLTKEIVSDVLISYVFRIRLNFRSQLYGRTHSTTGSNVALRTVSTTTGSLYTVSADQYPIVLRIDPSNPQQRSWVSAVFVTVASLVLITLTNTISFFDFQNYKSVPSSNRICQCLSQTNDNDENDPTDHNFDGEEHIEVSDDTSKSHAPSPLNTLRQSIFGASHTDRTTNVLDQEFQDIIKTISNDISSSFRPGKVAQQMKELMDQIIVPNDTTSNSSSEASNEDSFKKIMQCLFDILMDAMDVTAMTKSNDETEKEKIKGNCAIRDKITQAVADLLAAAQQLKVKKNAQELKDYSKNDETGTETPTTVLTQSIIEDTTSIFDLCNILMTYSDQIQQLVTKHMSNIDYQRITPTAMAYYADYANTKYESMLQERLSYHHPNTGPSFLSHNQFLMQCRSWQQHQKEQLFEFFNRHQPGDAHHITTTTNTPQAVIDPSILDIVKENPDAIALAQLAYADSVEQLRDGLQNLPSKGRYQYELIYCDFKSEPGKPAHFYTIRSDANAVPTPPATTSNNSTGSSTTLDVVLVIRGTKTVADAITDLLCDTQPYRRWGKAHSYILDSGRYIAKLYQTTFEDLLRDKNKNISNINVTIYGHSLGAGAGAIAAMELHNLHDSRIQVQMIGYGCPAILSKNLAEQTSDYITTFINDSDIVPRLSGLSLTNLLYDIIEFDWMPYAQKDVQNVFNDLQQFQPILFNSDTVTTMKNIITPIMESIYHDTYIPSGTIARFDVELFPPGKCIHLYRTSTGNDPIRRSACFVPNWFYSQIDVNKHMVDDHLLASGYIPAIADIQRSA